MSITCIDNHHGSPTRAIDGANHSPSPATENSGLWQLGLVTTTTIAPISGSRRFESAEEFVTSAKLLSHTLVVPQIEERAKCRVRQ